MSQRYVVYLLDKGILLSPFQKEDLYIGSKLDLKKLAQTECVASPSMAAAIIAAAVDGSIDSIHWSDIYANYIKTKLFTTYKELQCLINLLQTDEISVAVKDKTSTILNEFARFYMIQLECEEKILNLTPELFFKPLFYPSNCFYEDEIDIYCQYDKYNFQGFIKALFYYSINKAAFDVLYVHSNEFNDIEKLVSIVEKLDKLLSPDFCDLYVSNFNFLAKTYQEYCLRQYKIKYQGDIKFLDEQNIWKQIVLDEKRAYNHLKSKKQMIPDKLYQQFDVIESNFISHLIQTSGVDVKPTDECDPITVAIKRVAASKYGKNGKSMSKADWGVVFRLLYEQGIINSSNYTAGADLINKACGKNVTTAASIRTSHILDDIDGTYEKGWTDKVQNRQSANLLLKYKEIAKTFSEEV